jgi:hypothetical protein
MMTGSEEDGRRKWWPYPPDRFVFFVVLMIVALFVATLGLWLGTIKLMYSGGP